MNESASTPTSVVPSVPIATACAGARANAPGMRSIQERAYAKRGEQYCRSQSKSKKRQLSGLDDSGETPMRDAGNIMPCLTIGEGITVTRQFDLYVKMTNSKPKTNSTRHA
ncbi:hypothetical protein [Verminephrobacter eiseniae]|uniref:hypothetical protein n=1 Tax=Verminephrobacter eiseniae TaxID=364317 RepID=UPI0022385D64|nr:hypothetical protein [Verminephrobacter eiseniae]